MNWARLEVVELEKPPIEPFILTKFAQLMMLGIVPIFCYKVTWKEVNGISQLVNLVFFLKKELKVLLFSSEYPSGNESFGSSMS